MSLNPAPPAAVVAKTQSLQWMERAKAHLLQNYKQQPLVAVKGEGVYLWDEEGRRYLDLLGGIATVALGHCHPQVTEAVQKQVATLWHVSNVFYSRPQIELAEKLAGASGLERAFFCNSGAEANEALIKLARKVQKDRNRPERTEIITFLNSFHGRTLATVTATGQPKYQKGFEPLPAGFRHVPYGDVEALKAVMGPHTAAVLVEPIQGEGGVRAAPAGFLEAIRKLCDEHHALMLVDEIQTGMGRTGKVFAYQHADVEPDAFSLAKSLANGLPMGAMVCTDEAGRALGPGTHGSTFGGNLVAAAAANVVFSLIREPALLKRNEALGTFFQNGARKIQERHPGLIVDVRGQGLLLGIELAADAAPVVAQCRELGLLCNLAGEKTVRFAPAYVVTEAELEEGLRLFEKALVP